MSSQIITGGKQMQVKNKSKRVEEDKSMSSFLINYKYESDPQYPYLLALNLNRTSDQFEETRSMKMLAEWLEDYSKLSEILKYKYSPFLPKIQKILLGKFEVKAPIEYCLSRFLLQFFQSWEELTSSLVTHIRSSDRYSMEFLWYCCHSLVEDVSICHRPDFLEYLTFRFEEPLREYVPGQSVEARKVIEVVYFINIKGCLSPFKKNAGEWGQKFRSFHEGATGEAKLILLLEIIKNKNVLQADQASAMYWMQLVEELLGEVESRVQNMSIENPMDKQLLDLFMWLLDQREVHDMLTSQEPRYLKNLLKRMQPRDEKSQFIFEHGKYQQISSMLYLLFFEADAKATKLRLSELLDKFIGHSYFVLNEEQNYNFLDCLTKNPVQLEQSVIMDLVRVLSNNHIRRTLPAKVLMVLAQTISASLDSYELGDEVVGQCLKAFSESLFHKTNDPLIGELRSTVGKLFMGIMQRYSWEDGYKNDAIFGLCEESERNSAYVSEIIFEMLNLLIKKFGFSNETKIEPLLNDILNKTIANEEQLHSIISLLISVTHYLKYPKAVALIEEVCAKNPSKYAPFYLFQALALARESFPSPSDFQTISDMLSQDSHWRPSLIDINLMMLQIFFLKVNAADALKILRRLDSQIARMFRQLYKDGNYRLLTLVAGKTLPAAGGEPETLGSLQSYRWLREFSFDMLARSFYKSTSINVCYVFSNILLRSEHPGATLRWLAKEQFIDYLYQGLNDFLSKEKQFTLEIATTTLLFKLLKQEPLLVPSSSRLFEFTTLVKNVSWWDESLNEIQFVPFEENADNLSEILPEFRLFYEENILAFFKNYFKHQAEKVKKAEELEHTAHDQDI